MKTDALCHNLDISTHSLTRRLTCDTSADWGKRKDFNSQPHKEADEQPSVYTAFALFQLTASQGG